MFSQNDLMEAGREHWSKWLPKTTARLSAAGELEAALESAADLTLAEMKELGAKAGMTPEEAWPEVRANHLILDPRLDR